MAPEAQTVSVRGGMFSVELRRAGRGQPLVYLHGGGGAFPGWAPFLDLLAEDFDVLVPRHPGFGDSTGLEQIDDVVDMALFYLDFFDALGLEAINLAGTSLGGMFAAEIAALGGSYVSKLVLQAPVGLWLDDVVPPDFFAMSQDELLRATYFDPEAAQARLPPATEDPAEVAKAYYERQKSMAATAKFVWPLWDKGLKKRIHRIKAPTLLIWGEADGLVPAAYAEEFKRRIPGSRLVIMPRTGHVPSFEQADEYVRLLREFFQGRV
jgi:pimeloyl-ACP methyl ester carboxylesterase